MRLLATHVRRQCKSYFGILRTPDTSGFSLLRRSTVATFGHITPEIGMRGGSANGQQITVRSLLYVMVGHVRHHIKIIKERYGV